MSGYIVKLYITTEIKHQACDVNTGRYSGKGMPGSLSLIQRFESTTAGLQGLRLWCVLVVCCISIDVLICGCMYTHMNSSA